MDEFLDRMEEAVPHLRRYALALTRSRDLADDLVQDAIERALQKRRLYRPSGSVKSWLFQIMLNVYRNQLRAGKRQSHFVPIDELAVEPIAAPEQPGKIALAETARALVQLPQGQREVLLLVGLEGFSYAESAQILKIPIGTVMSRLGRARATLRRLTDDTATPTLKRIK